MAQEGCIFIDKHVGRTTALERGPVLRQTKVQGVRQRLIPDRLLMPFGSHSELSTLVQRARVQIAPSLFSFTEVDLPAKMGLQLVLFRMLLPHTFEADKSGASTGPIFQ